MSLKDTIKQLTQEGKWNEALDKLNQAQKSNDDPELEQLRNVLLKAKDQYEKIKRLFYESELKEAEGNLSDALKLVQEILELSPNNPEAINRKNKLIKDLEHQNSIIEFRYQAEGFAKQQDWDKAVEALTNALNLDPYSKEITKELDFAKAQQEKFGKATELFRIGRELLQKANWPLALQSFSKIKELNPEYPSIDEFIELTEILQKHDSHAQQTAEIASLLAHEEGLSMAIIYMLGASLMSTNNTKYMSKFKTLLKEGVSQGLDNLLFQLELTENQNAISKLLLLSNAKTLPGIKEWFDDILADEWQKCSDSIDSQKRQTYTLLAEELPQDIGEVVKASMDSTIVINPETRAARYAAMEQIAPEPIWKRFMNVIVACFVIIAFGFGGFYFGINKGKTELLDAGYISPPEVSVAILKALDKAECGISICSDRTGELTLIELGHKQIVQADNCVNFTDIKDNASYSFRFKVLDNTGEMLANGRDWNKFSATCTNQKIQLINGVEQ